MTLAMSRPTGVLRSIPSSVTATVLPLSKAQPNSLFSRMESRPKRSKSPRTKYVPLVHLVPGEPRPERGRVERVYRSRHVEAFGPAHYLVALRLRPGLYDFALTLWAGGLVGGP